MYLILVCDLSIAAVLNIRWHPLLKIKCISFLIKHGLNILYLWQLSLYLLCIQTHCFRHLTLVTPHLSTSSPNFLPLTSSNWTVVCSDSVIYKSDKQQAVYILWTGTVLRAGFEPWLLLSLHGRCLTEWTFFISSEYCGFHVQSTGYIESVL